MSNKADIKKVSYAYIKDNEGNNISKGIVKIIITEKDL